MAKLHEEEAYIYGQREGCFSNHREPPFDFSTCTTLLPAYPQKTNANGLISQDGLRLATLPRPKIDLELDSLDLNNGHKKYVIPSCDSLGPIAYDGIGISDQRGSALELPLLTSNAKIDLRNYLDEVQSKRCADIEGIWLPLISLAVEKDEGLEFPKYSERVQLLMQREVENETIEAINDKYHDIYLTDSNSDYHGLNVSSLPGYKVVSL